ncbi:MAG: low specificity L-threonine aldolase [bacterium]|nr:low specificity L-threonine aldolase [bacterium]
MRSPIEFRSDNAVGVAPEILASIGEANEGGELGYGGDRWTTMLTERVREVFGHATARIFPVPTGTAANALALSAMTPPWGAILCHPDAHIITHEGGASSLFSGGAVMTAVPGEGSRIGSEQLRASLEAVTWGDPHESQPAVLSLTQPTERGTVYEVADIAELSRAAAEFGLTTHVDGARLANAIARLGCEPADVTWKAGALAVTLGATKNGGMSTDAIVSFDDSLSDELVYRTKRAGHVPSKMRFQSVQLLAYLADDLWLRLAAAANQSAQRLYEGLRSLDVDVRDEPEANIMFMRLDNEVIDRLEELDLMFYRIAPGVIRVVTSFKTTDAEVDETLVRFRTALSG